MTDFGQTDFGHIGVVLVEGSPGKVGALQKGSDPGKSGRRSWSWWDRSPVDTVPVEAVPS